MEDKVHAKDGPQKERLTFAQYYRKHNDAFVAAFILTPMLLWWVIACGFPLAFGIVLGFFEMKGVAAAPKFIWFENFVTFFSSPSYLKVLWNTIWIGTVSTLMVTLCGLAVAILLNSVSRCKGLYRSVWYLPAVTSTVAVTQIIGIFFDPVNGVINNLLVQSGHDTISLDTDYSLAICAILFFSIWKGAGGSAIVWLAGLQAVDKNQYEAAELDGCNRWQKFAYITVPGLKPMATYIIITGMIGALQIYEPIAFISNGGPLESTSVLVLRIIQDGFFNFDFGMAGASSLILAIIVIFSTLMYYKFSRENVEKDEARARKRIMKNGGSR